MQILRKQVLKDLTVGRMQILRNDAIGMLISIWRYQASYFPMKIVSNSGLIFHQVFYGMVLMNEGKFLNLFWDAGYFQSAG